MSATRSMGVPPMSPTGVSPVARLAGCPVAWNATPTPTRRSPIGCAFCLVARLHGRDARATFLTV